MNQQSDKNAPAGWFPKLFNEIGRLPGEKAAAYSLQSLSLTEKLIFYFLALVLTFSALTLLNRVNNLLLVEVPARGGVWVEGIIGSPRFINPLLAATDADRDLVALIYSGLLKPGPDGELLPDLSQDYQISEDGLTYTFTLKNDVYFHDGRPVTAEDVAFTVLKAQDPQIKSGRRANWEGVKVEIENSRQIRFVLNQPYAPFLENNTLGILPKHLWQNLDAEQFSSAILNIEPVGSGPYQIKNIKRADKGLPVHYRLEAFAGYSLGQPFIKEIILRFYSNEKERVAAYEKKQIAAVGGVSPAVAERLKQSGSRLVNVSLPRIFGIFFNQNQASLFINQEVRTALNLTAAKQRIVDEILLGFGQVIDSPIPTRYFDSPPAPASSEIAREILQKNGWQTGEDGVWQKKTKNDNWRLEFSIATSDVPDLKAAAEILKEEWQKIGAAVEIKIFEAGDLNQNIIRPRRYQTLLFGTVIGRDLDFFPFWHSSQRNDPGLNIALYANAAADKMLEEGRAINDRGRQLEKYREFATLIQKETPAIFLYSPDFIYLVPTTLNNLRLGHQTLSSDRFSNVHQWSIKTEKIWKIFTK